MTVISLDMFKATKSCEDRMDEAEILYINIMLDIWGVCPVNDNRKVVKYV
jgi:hypothetical protein